jgi:hypothetical protein
VVALEGGHDRAHEDVHLAVLGSDSEASF